MELVLREVLVLSKATVCVRRMEITIAQRVTATTVHREMFVHKVVITIVQKVALVLRVAITDLRIVEPVHRMEIAVENTLALVLVLAVATMAAVVTKTLTATIKVVDAVAADKDPIKP